MLELSGGCFPNFLIKVVYYLLRSVGNTTVKLKLFNPHNPFPFDGHFNVYHAQ